MFIWTRHWPAVLLTLILTLAAHGGKADAPQITTLSEVSLDRSGRLVIVGLRFGTAGAGGHVSIGGLTAIATTWTDTEIHAYVPEASSIASVPVVVVTENGASNMEMLQVTSRQADGRLRWRFQTDRYTPLQHISIGPDGTIYTSDLNNLYALSPDGALLWVAPDAGGGQPITFGADGTIYTGGSLSEEFNGHIVKAFNPDGTLRWQLNAEPNLDLLAGPNIGPDGNIYAVQNTISGEGLGVFALDADGNVLFSNVLFWSNANNNNAITFGDGQFYAGWQFNPSGGVLTHVFDMDNGDLLWDAGDVGVSAIGLPILDTFGRLMLSWAGTGIVAVTPDGGYDWIAEHPGGSNSVLQAAVADTGTAYSGKWLGVELWAVNPDGSTRWIAANTVDMLQRLNVAADDSMIVAMGSSGFGLPGWARGYSTEDGSLVWHFELSPENGANQGSASTPIFAADHQTTYFTSHFLGDVNDYGYLHAVDVPFDLSLDQDSDGFADAVDNCPEVFNPAQIDSDGDGIGDACDFLADACTTALEICPGTITGSTVGATTDGSSTCTEFETGNRDVWFSYSPATSGSVTIDTCDGFFGNTLSIHSGCPGTEANQITCNDFCCQGLSCVTFDVVGGETYLVRLTGFNATEIQYTLTLDGPACFNDMDSDGISDDQDNCPNHANPNQADCDNDGIGDVCMIASGQSADCDSNGVPDECEIPLADCNNNGVLDACDIAGGFSIDCNFNGVPDECDDNPVCFNDACDMATIICSGTINGTTIGATPDGQSWCGWTAPDLWYSYTPTASGPATFSTCGSGYDSILSIHTGCPGTSDNTIVCGDDDCGDGNTIFTIPVTANETYLIRVSGWLGAAGTFVFSLDGPTCDSEAPVPGDVDGDGVVGFADLLSVLASWGVCVECPEDLDSNGVVGFSDILIVLANWM